MKIMIKNELAINFLSLPVYCLNVKDTKNYKNTGEFLNMLIAIMTI